jgi:hypothetical protein
MQYLSYQDRHDCQVLFERALLKKLLTAYGVDGHGLYGSNVFHRQFTVIDIAVGSVGYLYIGLAQYNARLDGVLATDQNLTRSINMHLSAELIDPVCWKYATLAAQGNDCLTLELDVTKLDL